MKVTGKMIQKIISKILVIPLFGAILGFLIFIDDIKKANYTLWLEEKNYIIQRFKLIVEFLPDIIYISLGIAAFIILFELTSNFIYLGIKKIHSIKKKSKIVISIILLVILAVPSIYILLNYNSTKPQKIIAKNTTKQSEDIFYIKTLPDEYKGVYLPIEYIKNLEKYRSHKIAMSSKSENFTHDVLFMLDNIIYANNNWHDQYAILSKDFTNYIFENNNGSIIVYDNNGVEYRKISNEQKEYYQVVDEFVAKQILQISDDHPSININNGAIYIKDIKYDIVLDELFIEEGNNLILRQREQNLLIGLIIENEIFGFRKLEQGDINSYNTDEILFTIKQ